LKNPIVLLLALAVAACTTPPARYDAFAGAMRDHSSAVAREAERVQLLQLPPVVASTPAPARRRGRRVAVVPPPPGPVSLPDCRSTASLTPAGRERCGIERRIVVTALVNRHAQALAAYSSALAVLGTRFDPEPAMDTLETSRGEAIALGDQLQAEIPIDPEALEPFRPIAGPVGLRPALASEMATNGWQIRKQLEIQAVALEWLELRRGDQTDEALRRLRWSIAHLRTAFENLTISDAEVLPNTARAREALGY